MKRKVQRTSWTLARQKLLRERKCRNCGARSGKLEAAHTLDRKTQDIYVDGVRIVPPEAIVPLCQQCHMLYDGRRLSIIGLLTMSELRNCLSHRSKARVRRRLASSRESC